MKTLVYLFDDNPDSVKIESDIKDNFDLSSCNKVMVEVSGKYTEFTDIRELTALRSFYDKEIKKLKNQIKELEKTVNFFKNEII